MRKVKIDKNPTVSPGPNSRQFPIYWPGDDWTTPETDVRNTLQPVDPEESDIEAEKGETVFVPDVQGLPAHFDIGGKRHSEGGTPLKVPDDSFFFSDTPGLKIKGPVLKYFGKSEDTKKKYTPADLAKKYDINKFRKTLADPDSDDYQRDTAEKMIANYNKKLGMLALVQESKKGFPDGIPTVALPYLITAAVEPSDVLPLQSTGQSQSAPISPVMKRGGSYAWANSPTGGGFWQDGGWFTNTSRRGFDEWMAAQRARALQDAPVVYPDPADPVIPAAYSPTDPIITGTPDGIPTTSGYRAPFDTGEVSPTAGGRASPKSTPRGSDISAWPGDRNDKSNKSEYTSAQWREFRDAFCPECKTNAQLQAKILTNPAFKEDIKRLHDKYGMPKNSPTTMIDNKLGHRWDFVFNKKPRTIEAAATMGQDFPPAGPIIPNKLKAKRVTKEAPWWLQDVVKTFGAADDFFSIKKYLPWAPKLNPYVPETTFYDPTRELANNTEQMNIGTQAAATFSGPQQFSARFSGIQGKGADNAANILGRYNNLNVGASNAGNAMRADIMNKTGEFNAKVSQDLYDKTTIANQQFDNAKREARGELRQSYIDSITNRANAQVLNELYPHYQIDPSTGGMMYFNHGDRMLPGSRSESFDERFQRARAMGISDDAAVKYALGPEQEQYLDARGDYYQNYRGARRSSPRNPESYPNQ